MAHHTTEERDAKIVVIGPAGVGKTSLVIRYVYGRFDNDSLSTIGASFLTKKIFFNNTKLSLQIWDTAGQERFRSMAPMYYRGASAALLVFDASSKETLTDLRAWVTELQSQVPGDIALFVACNKIDLTTQRQVSEAEAKDFAASLGAVMMETSAKTDANIEELFVEVAKAVLGTQATAAHAASGPGARAQTVRAGDARARKGRCGCS